MSDVSLKDALSRLPLFSTLSRQELELIEHRLKRRNLKAGEALFREGEPGNSCSILVIGEIKVFKSLEAGRVDQLAVLPTGALVGHISLIDRKPRSATCRAGATGATVLELSLEDFNQLFQAQSSFAYKILDQLVIDLSLRLRGATERLKEARVATSPKRRQEQLRLAAQVMAGQETPPPIQ